MKKHLLFFALFLVAIAITFAQESNDHQKQNTTNTEISKPKMGDESKSTQEFSGTIYVGTGQTYTSLTTNTTGLFYALNNGTVVGNITIYITSDLYEPGTVGLYEFAAPYTIEIRPNAASNRTISGVVNGRGVINLVGADRVTIDGSFNGSGQYLSIFNNYYLNKSIGIQLTSEWDTTACEYNTIKNCIIKAGRTNSSSYGIHIGGLNGENNGYNNDNNTIINNTIDNAYYGIYVIGHPSGLNNNIVINNNTIGSSENMIGIRGIYVSRTDGAEIKGNKISNFTATTDFKYGIEISSSVSNLQISANQIYDIMGTGISAKGIQIYTNNAASNISIDNNIIYNIGSPGNNDFSNGCNVGIGIYGTSGGINLYYNSVNLYGNCNRALATTSSALYIASGCSDIRLQNNILSNSIKNINSGSAKAYSIYIAGNNSILSASDYNDYYASGTQGILGYLSSPQATLPNWQSATGSDAHSLASDPQFRSNDQLQAFSGSPILAAGTPITGISTDFEGNTRNSSHPSIGAYENGYIIPAVDWANLQSPAAANKNEGAVLTVYARVFEDAVTNPPGQGAGIECWIGWNTEDTDPATWGNWTSASYNSDYGNNDEYKADISGDFVAGTYYFASRFQITDGNYQYGGYSVSGGNFWDEYNTSGVLTVVDNTIEWMNIQSPGTVSIMEGETTDIFSQIYAPLVTTLENPSVGITCEIGWSTENTDPSTWTNWESADFNLKSGNNHEYMGNIGYGFTAGTYYYASRAKLCDDSYVYGGFSAEGGGIWNGTTHISGELTVTPLIISLPYTQDFESVFPPDFPVGWLVEDVNADDNTWINDFGSLYIGQNYLNSMNDWVFSPGINVVAGVTYNLAFWYAGDGTGNAAQMEVKYGATKSAAGMTSSAIFYNSSIDNFWTVANCEVTAGETGTIYFGWHVFSPTNQNDLYLDDIEISILNGWTGLVDQNWSNPSNWAAGEVPNISSTVTINSPYHVHVDIPHAVCGSLTIKSGAKITIDPQMGLEANLIDNQAGEAGILIRSDETGTGGILCEGGVPMVFQRYIGAADWADSTDGWHFLSSPLYTQPISGDWIPSGSGNDYDFYKWDSGAALWLNQKVPENDISIFEQGFGYKVAYQQSYTHLFSGLSYADYPAFSEPIQAGSWILFGNPFPCDLIWNNNNHDWTMDGVADIAKIWSEENKSYTDIYPFDIIPATNGFMIMGDGAGGSVTVQLSIPPYARTLGQADFYKAETKGVYLEARELDQESSQQSAIMQHEEASSIYNSQCDSKFYKGYAPKFYSMKGNDALSTFAVPSFESGMEIFYGFEKNSDQQFQIVLNKEKSISDIDIFLKDLKTGTTQNLRTNPVYTFASEIADTPLRFKISLSPVGIEDTKEEAISVYSYDQQIFINGSGEALVEIYNLNGQKIYSEQKMLHEQTSIPFQSVAGCYIIRLIMNEKVSTFKIVMK